MSESRTIPVAGQAPILSLCIATLNRGYLIGETLRSIIEQANEDVEIVVVDGSSTDDTAEVVRRYQKDFARLSYHCVPPKRGLDADYYESVSRAQGRYCWLMSDDDLVLPGAINAVLDAAGRDYSVIVVNAESRSRDMGVLLQRPRFASRVDREYAPADYEAFFLDTVRTLTFLGCLIVRRDFWMTANVPAYFGTMFAHEGAVYSRPLPGAAFVDATPRVAIRHGNVSWGSRAFEIWMFLWPQLVWSFERLPAEVRACATPREPWRKLATLVNWRIQGHYSMNEYSRHLASRAAPALFHTLAKGVARIPRSLVIPPAAIYLWLFRRQSRIALYELMQSTLATRPRTWDMVSRFIASCSSNPS